MKQAEHLLGKANFDIRKRPINGKLFQNQKNIKDQLVFNAKKAMGKKYMQEHNIFKQKHDQPKKQHREIVMSEEFIKSSKLYRLLRQKMDRCDSMFIKQVNSLSEHKLKVKEEIMQLKSQSYQQKVSLWQIKNKLMQLKIMYHEQEEESKRLAEQNYAEYEEEDQEQAENQMENNLDNNIENSNQIEGEDANSDQYMEEKQEKSIVDSNQNALYKEASQEDIVREGMEHRGWRGEDNKQSRVEFREILEELMNLKAERQKIQHERSSSSQKPRLSQQHSSAQQRNVEQGSNQPEMQQIYFGNNKGSQF